MTISGIFSRGIVRQLRVRVRHRLAFRRAFGVHATVSKKISSGRKTEGSCRLQVSVATTRPRYTKSSCSPPRGGVHRYEYSHPVLNRHRGSLYYSLTPTSTIRLEFPAARAKQHRDTHDIIARANS